MWFFKNCSHAENKSPMLSMGPYRPAKFSGCPTLLPQTKIHTITKAKSLVMKVKVIIHITLFFDNGTVLKLKSNALPCCDCNLSSYENAISLKQKKTHIHTCWTYRHCGTKAQTVAPSCSSHFHLQPFWYCVHCPGVEKVKSCERLCF